MQNKRAHYLFLFFMIVIVNFFLPRLMPGSALKTIVGDDIGYMSAAEKMGILESYHLDLPLWQQFLYYLKELFTFQWGNSYAKRQPIALLMKQRIGWTLLLAVSNLILSTWIGTRLGIRSALKRKNGKGALMLVTTTVVSGMPSFWVAMILLAVFSVHLGWFPLYGAYSMWKNYTGIRKVLDILHHLCLPLLTCLISSLLTFITTSRYGAIKVISEDYIKMARLRGIPEKRINKHYIAKNTWVSVFTLVMLDIGYLLSGSVLVETVFSYPGLGTLMKDAVNAKDYPLIQYSFLVSSTLTIIALYLADLLYEKVDPRMENVCEK